MRSIAYSSFMACILFIGAANALDDWAQQYPDPHPSARHIHAMAYIGGNQVLLFGGNTAIGLDDTTWIYDFIDHTWSQRNPSPKPSARSMHALAYIGEDQVLLFGGHDGSDYDDETWVYDLSDTTWTQKTPLSSPTARATHAMAYIGGDQVLLFGGLSPGYDNETWIYDLSDDNWTRQYPSSNPSGRRYPATAYIGGDQVLLFGGDDGVYDDETWLYDLSDITWTQLSPSSKPSARYGHDMAYIGGDQVLLFGGYDGSYDNETWIYDLSDDNWTLDFNTIQPAARSLHVLSETSMDGTSYLLLHGGFTNTGRSAETWTFGGGDYPLSVELSSFTATGSQRMVTLEWTTQSEWNNRGFHIYRSDEPIQFFEKITQDLIPGAGNSAAPQNYAWVDRKVEIGRTYWYQLESVDFQGGTQTYGPVSVTPMEVLPKDYRLLQNFPNPFNPETWINYQLPQAGPVTIRIYNVNGQLIKILVDEEQTSDAYRVIWNGRDLHDSPAASGIYFCQLRSGRSVETIKMILLR